MTNPLTSDKNVLMFGIDFQQADFIYSKLFISSLISNNFNKTDPIFLLNFTNTRATLLSITLDKNILAQKLSW